MSSCGDATPRRTNRMRACLLGPIALTILLAGCSNNEASAPGPSPITTSTSSAPVDATRNSSSSVTASPPVNTTSAAISPAGDPYCPGTIYSPLAGPGYGPSDPRCTEPGYFGPPVTQGTGDAQTLATLINTQFHGNGKSAFGDDPKATCGVNPYPKSVARGAGFYCKFLVNALYDSTWLYGPVKYDAVEHDWDWVSASAGEPGGKGNSCPCGEMTPGQSSSPSPSPVRSYADGE